MKLKTNLHLHTQDDPQECIDYSFYKMIDQAAELGFEVIALTCHQKFINYPEYYEYASKKKILLIPGIEKTVEKRHVVILNASLEAEKIKTFKELEIYKKENPRVFIIAPHPYFVHCSLDNNLEKYIRLFDAIENSWFYSKSFNLNKKARLVAAKQNLPFISTSDTHDLKFLDKSYAVIEAKEKTTAAVFEAVREKRFENVTSPRKLFREMLWFLIKLILRNL